MERKLDGFMATTHALLSVTILFILMLLPYEVLQKTVWTLKDDPLLFVVGLIIFLGSSLLPDLDSNKSTAYFSAGIISMLLSVFMRTTSQVVWSVYKLKGDNKHPTNREGKFDMHRYLWHTMIIWVGIMALFHFNLPTGESTIFSNLSTSIQLGQLEIFIRYNATLLVFIILTFIPVLLGSSLVIRFVRVFYPKVPRWVKYTLPMMTLIYIFVAPMYKIRVLALLSGFGTLLHCIEDGMADSGVPLLFPIPIGRKAWYRVKLLGPLNIETGGTVNKILDFVLVPIVIVLFVLNVT